MTNAERTKANIETLRESIALDVQDLVSAGAAQRAGILQHMRWCADELEALIDELESHAEP